MPYVPILSSTPARMTEIAVGASTWASGNQLCQVKGVLGVEVENKHGNEHEHAAEQRVEEELDRRVLTPRPAPDANEKVHGQQHQFPENVEEEEVHGAEDTDHGSIE